jgi:hypothetical protein
MISRERSEQCLSDHAIDRLLGGEGGDIAHAESCASCSARIQTLRQEKDVFAKEIFIAGEAKKVERRLRTDGMKRFALAAGSIAAVVIVAWIALPPEQTVRTKGGLALEVIARHGAEGEVSHLLPGSSVSPGDAIRFRVRSENGGYLAISGLDAAQVVSIYHEPVQIEGGARDRLIEGSIILDQTLGPEQIAAIVCPEPPTKEQLVAAGKSALERAGGDPRRVRELDLGCTQAFFLIEKVGR